MAKRPAGIHQGVFKIQSFPHVDGQPALGIVDEYTHGNWHKILYMGEVNADGGNNYLVMSREKLDMAALRRNYARYYGETARDGLVGLDKV